MANRSLLNWDIKDIMAVTNYGNDLMACLHVRNVFYSFSTNLIVLTTLRPWSVIQKVSYHLFLMIKCTQLTHYQIITKVPYILDTFSLEYVQ